MITAKKNNAETKKRFWRWLAITIIWTVNAASTSAFLSTEASGATSLTRGIIVQEITIRWGDTNAPVAQVTVNQDYKIRVLIKNNSSSTKGFYYLDTRVIVMPMVGGAVFYSDTTYTRPVPVYTSPSGFTLKPGQSREIYVPIRFSQAGNSQDKLFRVTVTGAEIPMSSGSAQIKPSI